MSRPLKIFTLDDILSSLTVSVEMLCRIERGFDGQIDSWNELLQ